MKKRINLRYPVFFAAALCAGVFAGYIAAFYNINALWLIAVVPATAVFSLAAAISAKVKAAVIIITVAAVFSVGAALSFTTLKSYSRAEITSGGVYAVSGEVENTGATDYGGYVILKNVKADGKKLHGKVYFADAPENLKTGYKVEFSAKLEQYDAFPFGKLNYRAAENIKYGCTPLDEISARSGFSLFGSIRDRVRETLYDNLGENTAAICYAMLTGDTNGVDDGSLTAFRYGGIAHIFAVSGLHIGLVYGALYALLVKLRAGKGPSSVVALLFSAFYSGVCGFTLSSVRALIMCAVGAAATLAKRKYDMLNSLAVAVFIIVLFSPLSLFTIGFRLSVSAVFSIALLSGRIVRALKKVPRKISSSVGASLSATAGTAPVMLSGFGYLSGAGVALNIIVIPVISIIFGGIFACVCVSTVIPAAGILVKISALPLEALLSFVLACGFENALITGFGSGLFTPLYFVGLILLSDKINLKRKTRLCAVAAVAGLIALYCVARTFAGFSGYSVTAAGSNGGGVVIFKSKSGAVAVVTQGASPSAVREALYSNYCSRLRAVVIVGGENVAATVKNSGVYCKNVYIFEQSLPIKPFSDINLHYADKFTECGFSFDFTSAGCVTVRAGERIFTVCADGGAPNTVCDVLFTAVEAPQITTIRTVLFSARENDSLYFGDARFVYLRQLYALSRFPDIF